MTHFANLQDRFIYDQGGNCSVVHVDQFVEDLGRGLICLFALVIVPLIAWALFTHPGEEDES